MPLTGPNMSAISTVNDAQSDMRRVYYDGAPGVFVSGAVWLIAGLVAWYARPSLAVWTLLIGGAMIHPLSLLLCKILGYPAAHTPGNPMASLAGESTVWLIVGCVIAFGVSTQRIEWFFPAMMLMIGGRYFTFQTVYGQRAYWVLGALLCASAVAVVLLRAPVAVGAIVGACIELACAVFIARRASRQG